MNNIGWYHAQLGDHERAIRQCEEALALHERLGNPRGQVETLDSLAFAQYRLRRHAPAVVSYRQALLIFRTLSDRYNEADVLTRLGDVHRDAGETEQARSAWREALPTFEELSHAGADAVRDRLASDLHS